MACLELKIDERFEHLAKNHPCLGRAPHKGRLHLPVSPACNIKCRFCTRRFNDVETRPGVARQVLPVVEGLGIVEKARVLCPEISVVGIAGPGDSLATNHALECLALVHEQYPDLIGCMSTNGLMLPDRVETIVAAGVGSVTVTVNAVEPSILERIVERVVFDGDILTGIEAAELLIARQLEGIKALAAKDVLVKINSVLIPEINGSHIGRIAEATAQLGASIINIIPLIPQGDLAHLAAPDCTQLNEARAAAEEYLPVFRHCQHCRADACGLLGEDVSNQLYQNISSENTFSHG
ncbi:MAG: radical SAM protein [Peptococcaceae bacterium]|jgi:nitrogen fixation protein NifB|nr:radical SAM protein [Peptococcaceae bacterium]